MDSNDDDFYWRYSDDYYDDEANDYDLMKDLESFLNPDTGQTETIKNNINNGNIHSSISDTSQAQNSNADYNSLDDKVSMPNGDGVGNELIQNNISETHNQNSSISKINLHIHNESSLLMKLRNDPSFTKKEMLVLNQKIKKGIRKRKNTYTIEVQTRPQSGINKGRCTNCKRRILLLPDEAYVFKESFYHLTYGEVFTRSYVQILHNTVCSSLGLRRMSSKESRSIKMYFINFSEYAYDIIKKARNYIEEHPELRYDIFLAKKNRKEKLKMNTI